MINTDKINIEIEALTTLLSTTKGVNQFPHLLEQEFQNDYLKNYLYQIRLTLLLGFLLFNGGALIILKFFPDWQFPFSVVVNIGSPLLFLLILLSFTNLHRHALQLIIFIFSLTILVCLAIIAAVAPNPLKDLVYQGMLLPPLFMSTLGKIQYRYSIWIMITVMVVSNISYQSSGFIESNNYYSFIVNNYILLGGTSLCVISSYYSESHIRSQFLYVKLIHLKNDLLEHLINYDWLTGTANRRFLDIMLDKEWRRALRDNQYLGMLFIDFDYFKEYNDIYGHLMGDKALRKFARILLHCTQRPGDLVARYGGDEFVILLPNTSPESTILIAKKIQSAIRKLKIPHSGSKESKFITATIGISTLIPSPFMKSLTLLKQADLALNIGKKTKRNAIYPYIADTLI